VGFPGRLHHDANGAETRIGAFNGDGNAFALLVQTKNDELAGLLLAGDARGSITKRLMPGARNSEKRILNMSPIWPSR